MDRYVGIEYRVINAYAYADCLKSNLKWYRVVEEINETQDTALNIIIPTTELFIVSLTTSSCDQKYNHCFNSQHLVNNSVDAFQLSPHSSRTHFVAMEGSVVSCISNCRNSKIAEPQDRVIITSPMCVALLKNHLPWWRHQRGYAC